MNKKNKNNVVNFFSKKDMVGQIYENILHNMNLSEDSMKQRKENPMLRIVTKFGFLNDKDKEDVINYLVHSIVSNNRESKCKMMVNLIMAAEEQNLHQVEEQINEYMYENLKCYSN